MPTRPEFGTSNSVPLRRRDTRTTSLGGEHAKDFPYCDALDTSGSSSRSTLREALSFSKGIGVKLPSTVEELFQLYEERSHGVVR